MLSPCATQVLAEFSQLVPESSKLHEALLKIFKRKVPTLYYIYCILYPDITVSVFLSVSHRATPQMLHATGSASVERAV